ncbi:MAG: transporter substrate-binding domain-containing protein [Pseudomonadota bacterium]
MLRYAALLTAFLAIIACGESSAPEASPLPPAPASTEATPMEAQDPDPAQETASVFSPTSGENREALKASPNEAAASGDPDSLRIVGPLRDLPARIRTGDLDKLVDARVIRILTVHSPGRFFLEDGQGRGIVAEMAARYENHLNESLGRGHVKVYVIVVPVARDQLVPALLSGRGDLISAGLTVTPQRSALVDFSIPMSKPLNEVLVTGPSAPELTGIEDLAGEIIYLREDSSYRESVDAVNDRFATQGLDPILIKALPGSLEDDDLIEMVNAGLLPWAVVDDYKPQLWEGVFEDIRVRGDIVFREGGRIAWAMRKESPQLKASVDAFLRENREGTLIGNILRNRYIRDFDWAANALSEEDYERFNNLEEIFRRYGEQYGIEYLFAAAQGYQESRLDQSVRSAAGAIGVMQLLPATATDRNVGIPDIHEVEDNIHAGIKYMDFLRNRYFTDPEITPINKALLSLAAYNAGPGRMIGMRGRAADKGYDPNVWFDNVELIAAEEIGRETVQYVSNIFRYYLTYRMIANQELRHAEARRAVGLSDAPDLEP